MSTIIQPDELATIVRELQRRLRGLESGNNATFVLGGNFGWQMVDATYSARCRFVIPPTTIHTGRATLNMSLQPFRSGSTAPGAGGTSGTSSAGHSHSLSGNTATEGSDHTHGTPTHSHITGTTGSFTAVIPAQGAIMDDGTTFNSFIAPNSPLSTTFHTDTSGAGTSGGRSAAHAHGQTGNTGTPSADHTHSIPSSSIALPSALYETGMARDCHVLLDGTDRTSALGGPWGAGAALDVNDLDLSPWLSATGWHEVQITSSQIGGVFAQVAVYATLNG